MKLKNIMMLIGILLLFVIPVFVIHKVLSSSQEKERQYVSLPGFRLPDMEGKIVSDVTIHPDKAVLFYFFDPECAVCRLALNSMKTEHEYFSDYQILLVTLIPMEKVKVFMDKIDFSPSKNVRILLDENAKLFSLMDIKAIPASLIYKKSMLVKRFNGQVKMETLVKYLK